MLEMEGLVSTRPGRNGGSIARRPGPAGISRSLATYVRGQDVSFAAVLEAREALEPALAALAAQHRSADDIRALEHASAAMACVGDNAEFIVANTHWHWTVAQASHNPVLVSIMGAIGELLHQSNVERFISREVRRAVVRAHARIEAAIRQGDPEAARRRMARHLASYREQVTPVAPDCISIELPGS